MRLAKIGPPGIRPWAVCPQSQGWALQKGEEASWGICWGLEPPAKLKTVQFSTFILELLYWNPLNSSATLGKNTSLVKGKEKPKRSLEVVFMQEKEDDLPERLSSTNCLPADGTEQEFRFSPWQFMQASAEQKSFGGMEQPGCCCPHLSTMVAFSPAGWMHSHYAGRKTNPQHCNHLQVQLLFVLLYICLN